MPNIHPMYIKMLLSVDDFPQVCLGRIPIILQDLGDAFVINSPVVISASHEGTMLIEMLFK